MVRKKNKDIAFTIFLAVLGCIIIMPIVLMFISSLKDDRYEIMKDMGSLKAFTVSNPTLKNFHEILFESVQNFGRAFLNSVINRRTYIFCNFNGRICNSQGKT